MAMSKQEILEAINSTIVANGQKGITAESLNLILNEMVESSGEAGGGGSSAYIVHLIPDEIYAMFEEFGVTEFTRESISAFFNTEEGENVGGVNGSMYSAFMKMFDDNISVYNAILNAAKNGSEAFVIVSTGIIWKSYIDTMIELDPEASDYIEAYDLLFSSPVHVDCINMKMEGVNTESVMLRDIVGNQYSLLSSGSCTGELGMNNTFYLPIPDDEDEYAPEECLSEDQMAVNRAFISNIDFAASQNGIKLENIKNVIAPGPGYTRLGEAVNILYMSVHGGSTTGVNFAFFHPRKLKLYTGMIYETGQVYLYETN